MVGDRVKIDINNILEHEIPYKKVPDGIFLPVVVYSLK